MKIAKRIRDLAVYAHGEQPRELDVIKLNTNEAAYPPSRKVMAALGEVSPEAIRRYPDAEFRELRKALSRLHGTTEEHIFVGNGSDECLSLFSKAFVEDDEAIGTLDPSYSLYKTLAAIRGVKWHRIGCGKNGLVAHRDVSLAIITNPNNPTGCLIPSDVIESFAQRFRGVIVVDEAYADYARWNCMELALSEHNDNLIVMRTFSKAYALAGMRIGYCVGPVELISALYKIKDSYNVDVVAQHLALAAVNDQSGLRKIVCKVLKTRTWFCEVLVKRGWKVMPSDANFIFCSPPPLKRTEVESKSTQAQLIFKALRDRKILIRWFPTKETREWLRFSIGTDRQMQKVLSVLDEIGKC